MSYTKDQVIYSICEGIIKNVHNICTVVEKDEVITQSIRKSENG